MVSPFWPLKWLKRRLSRVREDSWHYRLTAQLWDNDEKKLSRSKACTYYWVKLPSTMIAASLFFGAIFILVMPLGWIAGFRPVIDEHDLFLPYKTTKSGKKRLVAPWQVLLVGLALGSLYYLALINQSAGMIALVVSVGIVMIALLAVLLWKLFASRYARWFYHKTGYLWGYFCPQLTVIPKDEEA